MVTIMDNPGALMGGVTSPGGVREQLATQGDRVAQLLRQASQPAEITPQENNRLAYAAIGLAHTPGGMTQYLNMQNNLQQGAEQRQTQSAQGELQIYQLLHQAKTEGDADSAAAANAITNFTQDPEKASALLQALHSDPEHVGVENALMKVYQHAAQLGYQPDNAWKNDLEKKKTEAEIAKLQSDADLQRAKANGQAGSGMSLTVDPTTGEISFSQGDIIGGRLPGVRGGGAPGVPNAGQFGKKLPEADLKQIEKAREDAETSSALLSDIRAFKQSSSKLGNYERGKIAGKVSPLYSADAQTSEAASNRIALTSKAILSMPNNNFSDGDREYLTNSVVNIEQKKGASDAIGNSLEAAARRSQEYGNFIESYAAQHGTTLGANAAWQKFGRENNIFNGDGSVNEAAISGWGPYINGGSGNQRNIETAPPPTSGQANPDRGLAQEYKDRYGLR